MIREKLSAISYRLSAKLGHPFDLPCNPFVGLPCHPEQSEGSVFIASSINLRLEAGSERAEGSALVLAARKSYVPSLLGMRAGLVLG
jgi:hypothetical protein